MYFTEVEATVFQVHSRVVQSHRYPCIHGVFGKFFSTIGNWILTVVPVLYSEPFLLVAYLFFN